MAKRQSATLTLMVSVKRGFIADALGSRCDLRQDAVRRSWPEVDCA
jgi:hypothetical protein